MSPYSTPPCSSNLRRFLLHVLPTGLVRIRQFGFLANRVRKLKLQQCRGLLATPSSGIADPDQSDLVSLNLGHDERNAMPSMGRIDRRP
jgi:hypothetical protein